MHRRPSVGFRVVCILGILAATGSLGCAVQVYSRAIDGAADHGEPVDGSKVAVLADPGAETDPVVGEHLETLLLWQGFEVVPVCEADFVMLYDYEVTDHGLGRGIEPLSGPASGIRTSERPGPYDHTVHLRLIEAPPWLHAGETRLAWAGVAQVSEAPTGGTRFRDIALICAVGDVRDPSGETVANRIRIHDRRVRDLR
jgi:hypothetical protein